MKNKNTESRNWVSDFKTHLLESITWGKLAYIAVIFATSFFLYLSFKPR